MNDITLNKRLGSLIGSASKCPTFLIAKRWAQVKYLMRSTLCALILILLLSGDAYACNCKSPKSMTAHRDTSFKYAAFVFLGELVDIDLENSTYTFRLIEGYKGNVSDSLIFGKALTTCSILPREKCRWIVYADVYQTGFIDISGCSATRSENNPICIGCYGLPDPVIVYEDSASETISTEDNERFQSEYNELLKRAKSDWHEELEFLRQK